MKLRIANGEDLNSTEFSVWAALAQQMVDAVMTDSQNAQKYFSYSENPEVRKPSACFSLNVGMDDFAMCIKAETIVKQVQIKDDALKSFLAKWDKVPKLGRVKRDPEVEALLMERRARFEKELTVCKAEENASARETCIVKLENSYLDEKYGYDSQDKDMILESNTSRQVSGERMVYSPILSKEKHFESSDISLHSLVRKIQVTSTHTNYVNLFDVPCPDSEGWSLCTQFCCQEGAEHNLYCNLLIECY